MSVITAVPITDGGLSFNDDGSACDPKAVRERIRTDPRLLAAVQSDESVAQAMLGDDDAAMQALLRSIFQARVCTDGWNCHPLSSP